MRYRSAESQLSHQSLGPFAMSLTEGQDWYGAPLRDQDAVYEHVKSFYRHARRKWRILRCSDLVVPLPIGAVARYQLAVENVCS